MVIEIIDTNDNNIQRLNLDCNPFNVGQIIHLKVNNRNKENCDVVEINKSFIIKNIEHYVRVDYLHMNVSNNVSVSVTVDEIN